MELKWGKNEEGRLVTHADGDGVVSAALMYSMSPENFSEVRVTDYHWIDEGYEQFLPTDVWVDLPSPLVDVKFWADHHGTGKRNEKYNGQHLFDPDAPSCAGLIYRGFVDDNPDLSRFEELVLQTDVTDSAAYERPEDLVDLSNYANKIRLSLLIAPYDFNDKFFKPTLAKKIADAKDWRAVLDDSFVEDRAKYVLSKQRKYQYAVDSSIVFEDGVVTLEFYKKHGGIKNRYYPFVKHPDSFYGLFVSSFAGVYIVSASENIFAKNKGVHPGTLDLGKHMQKHYGGGGHKGIGIAKFNKKEKHEELPKILQLLKDEVVRIKQ